MYQLKFLAICVGVGVYLLRGYFTGFPRKLIGNIVVPSYIIAALLSLFVGGLLYIMINIALWQFRGHL
jgi:asparagine N-glycosylation enzyme membrane subunit Stt3